MENEPTTNDIQRAFRVCSVSVAWSLFTGIAAIVFGIASNRLALVAFGGTNVLDSMSSSMLTLHFHHFLKHEQISEARERRATWFVFGGLVIIGSVTIVESVRRFSAHGTSRSAPGGVAVTIASALVLTVLSHQKLTIGRRIKSVQLFADGYLSAIGALLAIVASVSSAIDRKSIDAVASGVIGAAAIAAACFMWWTELRAHRD